MKKINAAIVIIASVLLTGLFSSCNTHKESTGKILIFSKTVGGYRHESIEAGKRLFIELGKEYGYKIDTTEDATQFTNDNLQKYKSLVFLSTRGDVLDSLQQESLKHYIRNGGGFAGIHAATTTEYDWPWYNQLIGAYFDGHPEPQEASYQVIDKNFPATASLPDSFQWHDEVYNFRALSDSLHYLITVDEKSYNGGKMGEFHPISWYQEFEGGRSFYIGLGHFDTAYTNPFFVQQVWKGISWTMKQSD